MSTTMPGRGNQLSRSPGLSLAATCFMLATLPASIAQAAAVTAAATSTPHAALLTQHDSATLQHELRNWFAAFSVKNYAAIGQYFAAPYTAIGDKTIVLKDMNAVRNMWQHTREALNGTAYSHTEAIAIRVIPRSATHALLNIHWRRVNRDGSTQNEGSEFYFATKESGEWRFNGGMSQNLAEYGPAGAACDNSSAGTK
ncbi:MAG TPA: hypothetical protein VID71_06980 [Steroidobacteraceae bacterium]